MKIIFHFCFFERKKSKKEKKRTNRDKIDQTEIQRLKN